MKFEYEYRTKDNVRHYGVIKAASRDAAFAALKEQGVKPGRLWDAPGLVNAILGKGKRWAAIVVLVCLSISLGILAYNFRSAAIVAESLPERSPRHQIYGDPVVLEEWARTAFSSVFENAGDRIMAAFAQPGVLVGFAEGEFPAEDVESLSEKMIEIGEKETREIVELKQIVNGMKDELCTYLSAGGSRTSYLKRLLNRLAYERGVRDRVARELEGERNPDVWYSSNAKLRDMGLRPIQPPDFLEY